MKKHTLLLTGMLAAALVLGLVLTGCEDATTPAVPTVTGVTVSAAGSAVSVISGQTLQFSAAVDGTNGPSQAVTWSITTAGKADETTISDSGLLTVAAGETETPLEIKATSTADTTKSGTKSVTVIPANTNAIDSVTIKGEAAVGQTLTATAEDEDGDTVTDAAFQWKRSTAQNGTYNDIVGATNATYTIITEDKDKYLKVSAINTATGNTAKLSSATGPVTAPLITYTAVQVGGVSDTTTSTGIALTFNEAVAGLTASEITLTNGTGAATKSGEPTGSGTSWTLGISGVSQGNVSVSINKTGIESAVKTVAVYKVAPTALTFTAATTTASGFGTDNIRGVAYGSDKFVAVGTGTMAYSLDGAIWTTVSTANGGFSPGNTIRGVAYGGGKFVAVGGGSMDAYGKTGTSTNGTVWSTANNTGNVFGSNNPVRGVAYGGDKFVAVGGNTMATSSDGTSWTRRASAASSRLNGVAYGGDKFVAVGNGGTITTSPDGTSWTAVSTSGFSTTDINGVAYGGGTFVAVGNSGKMATSPDGTSWTAISASGFSTTNILGVAYGGGKFVAVGDGGKIATSPDGTSWTAVSATAFDTTAINGVTYGGGKFVAVGVNGKIAYSNPQE